MEDESNINGQSNVSFIFVFCFIASGLTEHCQCSNGLTKLDSELAHYRGILEQEYSNDSEAGYMYIDSMTLESIPLTPFMMKEWAHSLVSFSILSRTEN